ncbi:ultraviolet-B receptor UVR8-like [Helianthus annuus]|uniref:ultraviolet-B receptor UVR8-like n=1 Tax=Helianthus annuus TaxID=4232 RepID=UPI000B8F997F|nr:ultraviolet-B receptor UVR8-like [Helianthus annuus]
MQLGGSHHGALSNPQKEISVNQDLDEGQVKEISGLDWIKVAGVASGSEHSVITTENGVIMTWGWGEHGQLGLGDTCDHTCPQVSVHAIKNEHSS